MTSGTVQQIKDRLNIADVVGSYLKLEKAGANLKACCPFHKEKTPSFFVSPARGSYHCFGCNRGGDLISFVEEMEGLDFLGAVRALAERAGLPLDTLSLDRRDPEKEAIYAALAEAQKFYAGQLRGEPLDYIRDRGVSAETIGRFGLGWAADGWRNLHDHLRQLGQSEVIMEKAGLILKSNRSGQFAAANYYDRFRGRIMFPLRDGAGRTVGFSGRIFPHDDKAAKYLNSPETLVYDKGRLLYGYGEAKAAIRREDRAILVEGQFDLVMSHQSGVGNAVAVSGTALTRDHLELLGRLTGNLVMAFDGDRAGLAAASRAIALALDLGLDVRIARLPAGEDPADLARARPEEWRGLIDEAKHVIDFLLEVIAERSSDERETAHAIKAEIYPYLGRLRERIDRAHFAGKIARLTGLSEEVIQAGVEEARSGGTGLEGSASKARPDSRAKAPRSRLELIEERLAGFESLEGEETSDPEVADLRREREAEKLRLELTACLGELRAAERRGDEAAVRRYSAECQTLSRQINNLKNN